MNTLLQNEVIRYHQDFIPSEARDLTVNASMSEANNLNLVPVEAYGCASLFENSITAFLDSLQANNVADNTLRSYSADVHRFMDFLKQRTGGDLDAVKTQDIEAFLRQMNFEECSGSAIRRTKASLKKFFRYLVETGAISTNPFESASFEETFADRLNLTTILSLCVYCRRRMVPEGSSESLRYRRDELIILLMIIYGVRQYQIGSLKLSRIKRAADAIVITLSDDFLLRIEGIVLTRLFAYLTLRNSKADVIFIEASGKPVSSRSLHALMIELSYAVRVQINPRTLHHTHLHLHHHPEDASRLLHELSQLDEDGQE
ncbi:MAG: site-specific integrase [Ignavibacteriae bacterium]|nr:site-specific integrase [Ignavibacteriota bacterium]